jgi:TP53 regulating kinase-like protein
MTLIQQGAEARVYYRDGTIIKERVKKSYRHEAIDKVIRKCSTRREAKLLAKAAEFIPVPKVIDSCDKDMTISMEFLEGKKLRDCVEEIDRKEIFVKVGKKIARLHNAHIIHGDLTTSNIIVHEKVYFIDFGLGFVSTKVEDKAVDVHLIRKALESKHYKYAEECFNYILKGYESESKEFKEVMNRLEKVEKRGRYKQK